MSGIGSLPDRINCTLLNNATTITIMEPPEAGVNVTACGFAVYKNNTDIIESCSSGARIDKYYGNCMQYVNLSKCKSLLPQ